MTSTFQAYSRQYNVYDYGAVGDGATDDYAAFAAALAAIYTAKGGVLYVPYSASGYVLGTSLSIDVGQYAGGGGISVQLNGSLIKPSHAGWCFDIKTNFFGANNSGGGKYIVVNCDGAQIHTSNSSATGGVRLSDCVGAVVEDLNVTGYSSGTGVELFVSTSDQSTWCEFIRLVNVATYGCLNGVYTKTSNPASPGSFLGCVFEQINANGTTNNAKLFNLEGMLTSAAFYTCGGYYNQGGATGGNGFYLNGSFQGCSFVSPWIDSSGTQSTATDIVLGANYTATPSRFPTIFNAAWISLPVTWRSNMFVAGALLSNGTTGTNTQISGNPREVLSADRTYYVATTGSDSNNGLASGAPFLTIGHALSVISGSIDFGGHTITVQLADGTYTEQVNTPVCVGQASSANLVIAGNGGTPTNVTITSATNNGGTIECPLNTAVTLYALEVVNTGVTSGGCISARGGHITLSSGVNVGACSGAQIFCNANGFIDGTNALTVVGNAGQFMLASFGGYISVFAGVAFGTRTYSSQTIYATSGGTVEINGTFTGTVTGQRYLADTNGVIQTYTGNVNYIPGSSAGSTATGGQYA